MCVFCVRNLSLLQRFIGSLSSSGVMDAEDTIGGFALIWADFPTGLALTTLGRSAPSWNMFGDDIVESVFVLAAEFLLHEGTIVCTLRAEHLGIAVREGESAGFKLARTLFLHLPRYMYVNTEHGQDWVSMLMR